MWDMAGNRSMVLTFSMGGRRYGIPKWKNPPAPASPSKVWLDVQGLSSITGTAKTGLNARLTGHNRSTFKTQPGRGEELLELYFPNLAQGLSCFGKNFLVSRNPQKIFRRKAAGRPIPMREKIQWKKLPALV